MMRPIREGDLTPHFFTCHQSWGGPQSVATLGPVGTSSERAGVCLLKLLGSSGASPALYKTYHDAGRAVLESRADLLLVANAFHDINVFYMDPRFCVSIVFHMHTPLYGLAVRDPAAIHDGSLRQLSVVSHPAPVPLIDELLPRDFRRGSVSFATSTAAAAASVARAEYDLALTTEPAAQAHGLTFVSAMRPIEMVWTAFALGEGRDDARHR